MDAEPPVERSRQRSPIYRERLRVVSCRAVFDVALELARAGCAPYRILDGEVIEAGRCREKTISRTSVVRSGRRSPSGILASTLTVAVIAVALAAISSGAASASVRATSPQKAGMAELMKSYNPRTGLIGNVWWQAAVALSTLETYQQASGDTGYRNAIFTAFKDHKRGNFENSYNDDTGWWGLAWLQAYDITRSRRYLAMAETDANYMHRSWDGTCRGGVYWRTAKAYKNAITNEIFLELTAWLHNTIRGDTKYLKWAKTEWSWFKGSGMISKSDLINDGLNSRCASNRETTWTYNQGVILAGLAQLYRATKTPGSCAPPNASPRRRSAISRSAECCTSDAGGPDAATAPAAPVSRSRESSCGTSRCWLPRPEPVSSPRSSESRRGPLRPTTPTGTTSSACSGQARSLTPTRTPRPARRMPWWPCSS